MILTPLELSNRDTNESHIVVSSLDELLSPRNAILVDSIYK